MGSCFSDHIGNRLIQNKFDTITNPLGIIYNPYSIFSNLRHLINQDFDFDNTIENEGILYHWDTHSDISATESGALSKLLHDTIKTSTSKLSQAKWLIITLGTSYVYEWRERNIIVANCHKVPQKQFDKRSLTVDEIKQDYSDTLALLRTANPELKVILTVSPVRHIRDGLVENNYSKSVLIQAVHDIIKSDSNAFYFPSYEIMIDELRDYRFYKEDMTHPSDQAINYIWQKFSETFFDEHTIKFLKEWSQILRALNHRPFHPESYAHQKFLHATISKLEAFAKNVNVEEEISQIKNQLI